MKGEEDLTSVSIKSWEGDVALEVEGESSNDSELPLTFIHSITVVPVAVLEPDRDLKEIFKIDKKRQDKDERQYEEQEKIQGGLNQGQQLQPLGQA